VPKYRFEFPDDDAEPVVLEFPNDQAAKAEAMQATADALADKIIVLGQASVKARTIVIEVDTGRLVATIM
jgi:hypothetical protein